MSKKYRVISNYSWEDFGLQVGDIVTKVEGFIEGDLYELPEHLHGRGHTGYTRLNLKEPNYLFIDADDLEEIKEYNESIYKDAVSNTQILLALVNAKDLNSKKKYDLLTQVEQALEQAIKQEKLLELLKTHYRLVPFRPGLGDNAKAVIDNSHKIESLLKELESNE